MKVLRLYFVGAMLSYSIAGMSQTTPAPPGKLVDIGGYRLHLNCAGKGPATVLLEYGSSGNSMEWALVQPEIARFARVCSYDRAYEGWSDAGPLPPSMHQQVYELHLLLGAANIRPPYVLVGWSLGGIIDRLYTAKYPGEVEGIVLVDATHEDITFGEKRFRDMATGKPIPDPQTMKSSPPQALTADEQSHYETWKGRKEKESQGPVPYPWNKLSETDQSLWRYADLNARFASGAKGRQEEWLPEEFQLIHESRKNQPHPLGDIPLIILGAGKGDRNAHEPARAAELKDMETLSTNSEEFVDESSSHGIPLENPTLISRAVQEVLRAVRTRTRVRAIPQN